MGLPARTPRLVGRDAEIRALGEALDRVGSGHPTIVLVEGEAGIGKTRLLEHALAEARARGMQVVAGRAEELERTRPFGLLAAAFGCATSSPDPRLAAIGALLATHGVGDGGPITVTSDPGLQFRTVDAFTDLAEEIALAGPLVIGLDDLQWADPSSLLTLGAVGRRLPHVPVAVIGCMRLAPRLPELDRLAGALQAAGARHLALAPLRDDAVHDLVADTVAAEPGPGLLAEIGGAAGNPLFITELIGAIIQEGAIKTASGRAEVTEMTLPPTLRLTILRRLSILPAETLQALRTASILGSVFSLTDLATVTGSPALGLAAALAEAIRTCVIEDDGTRLRFRHDLIRDSLYEDLPQSVRRGLHREAGQRLAQAGAPTLRVARHLAKGATRGDAEAIAWLTRGAREAAATSPDIAADLLGRAIALIDPADTGRDLLLAEQAGSLTWAGRLAEAETTCRALLSRNHDPSVTAEARICLGHMLLADGRTPEALRELAGAADSAASASTELATARAYESFARLSLGDLDGAWAAAAEAQSAGPSACGHQNTSVAMTTLALAAELRGELASALRIADEGVRRADHSPGRLGHSFPVLAARGVILIELDRLDEARSTLQAGMRTAEELGVQLHLPSYQVFLAFERFTAGEWDDALAEAQAALELASEVGETYTRVSGQIVRSLIMLHRNDFARGDRTGVLIVRMPLPANTPSNAAVNLLSRSRIRNLKRPARSPGSMSKLRACWAVHAPVGCSVTPRMCTCRVWISITKKMYRRVRNTVSTCRKPHARIPDAWEARNCRQVGDARRGEGLSLAAARIRRIVPAPMRWPRPRSSPWIRRCPHLGFCLASCWTSARISSGTGGRPAVLGRSMSS
ncbi:MAG TPA: BREX system ATP-binding domain-containing protein [Streptosporangiaceae bacterium]